MHFSIRGFSVCAWIAFSAGSMVAEIPSAYAQEIERGGVVCANLESALGQNASRYHLDGHRETGSGLPSPWHKCNAVENGPGGSTIFLSYMRAKQIKDVPSVIRGAYGSGAVDNIDGQAVFWEAFEKSNGRFSVGIKMYVDGTFVNVNCTGPLTAESALTMRDTVRSIAASVIEMLKNG